MTHALAPDPFAPLSSDETDHRSQRRRRGGGGLRALIAGARRTRRQPNSDHRELGEPAAAVDLHRIKPVTCLVMSLVSIRRPANKSYHEPGVGCRTARVLGGGEHFPLRGRFMVWIA